MSNLFKFTKRKTLKHQSNSKWDYGKWCHAGTATSNNKHHLIVPSPIYSPSLVFHLPHLFFFFFFNLFIYEHLFSLWVERYFCLISLNIYIYIYIKCRFCYFLINSIWFGFFKKNKYNILTYFKGREED